MRSVFLLAITIAIMATYAQAKAVEQESAKTILFNRAVTYAKSLYNNYVQGKGARNIADSLGGDDEDLLLLLLGAAALFLPLILGGLALAAIIPFIGTTLNPITAGTGIGTGLQGITGTIPTITASTFNPGGRRRRDAAGVGFSSKLVHQLENFLKKLE